MERFNDCASPYSPCEDGFTSGYYVPEGIMQDQHARQQSSVQRQCVEYEDWRKEEQHLVNKTLVSESFQSLGEVSSSWVSTAFTATSHTLSQGSSWSTTPITCSPDGLQLKDLVVKLSSPITLRSIGVEVKLSARLVGNATIWVFSRGDSVTDPKSAICKVKKEQDSQRVFLVFGAALGKNAGFKFLCKQEVPSSTPPAQENILLDFTEIKLTLIDNGDNRVIVRTSVNGNKECVMSCNKYVPTLKDSSVLVAGSGTSVLLRDVSAKQVRRMGRSPNSQRTGCCSVF